MSMPRTISALVLSILAGLLLGFGLTTISRAHTLNNHNRIAEDIAALIPGNVASDDHNVGFQINSQASPGTAQFSAQSTVGVGGSFVSDVYDMVSPAVVHITNRIERQDFFFGPINEEATGSGVIVSKSGYILTNYHVIQNATDLQVVTNDGQSYSAEIIGADAGTDLALIKVNAQHDLPVAKLGDDTKLRVGEWVVAIGNPRGLDWTVTVGVVSALNREITNQLTNQTLYNMIQTDATINPGNSGGPLLNAAGEVIGINDVIVSNSGGSEGIGLAIPVSTVKDVLDDLITNGRVMRPWLGLRIYRVVNEALARQHNLPVTHGIIPREVYEGSPAANAGIIRYYVQRRSKEFGYDIISEVDGKEVTSERQMLDIIRNHEPGEKVTLTIYRVINGSYEKLNIDVVLTELDPRAPLLGIV
ncbi:MAG: trypsin-like peptidase domain-containing protein [Planctomycetales bacterium]|nr:trypsin-like peptidase domain-containing protein [bacterium]UNM07746.1 MAG: trypsin-like peptidase domain-containing protein [Planctomycetales bacterium]